MAGRVRDLWFKKVDGEKVMTERHPKHPASSANGGHSPAASKRWLAVWRDDGNRERSKAFETKAEAESYAQSAQVDSNRGTWVDPDAGRESFKTYADRWIESQSVEATTRYSYRSYLRHYIYPTFESRQIRQIAPSEVRNWITILQKQRVTAKDGTQRTLAPRTVGQAHRILGMVLESAVDDGLIPKNAARAKTAKSPKTTKKDVEVWSPTQVLAVRDSMADRYRELALVMACAGLRQGEAFGLAVEDVDFLRHEIHVRRQVRMVQSTLVFSKPKYGRPRKTPIPVPSFVTDALAAHLVRWPGRLVELPTDEPGDITETHRLLFTTREHGPVNRNYFNTFIWKPALISAGVEPNRANGCHVLRHTFASQMLANGVGVPEVASWLGHADPGFTLRVYGHLVPNSDDRGRAAMQKAFTAPVPLASGTGAE